MGCACLCPDNQWSPARQTDDGTAMNLGPAGALYKRLVREAVAPYLGAFIAAGCCMAVVAASTAALAWLMNPVVNEVFVARRAELLWPVGLAVFATFALKGLASYG